MKKIVILFALLFINSAGFAVQETIVLEPRKDEISTNKFKLQIETSPYLTGDWGGLRSKLEEKGIDIQSSYVTNPMLLHSGEKKSSRTMYQGLYNISLELDSEKLGIYKGGKFLILYQKGGQTFSPDEYLDTYSGINAFSPMGNLNHLGELWYEHSFKEDLLNIKIGKHDVNLDFQAIDAGFDFLNASFWLIPNTHSAPFYPMQQTGVRARLKLTENVYLQNGIYDGNPGINSSPKGFFNGENGYFDIVETYYLANIKGHEGKYHLGSWIKTGNFKKIGKNDFEKNDYGGYLGFDQNVYRSRGNENGGFNVFGRFGYADIEDNEVPFFYSGGFYWKGIAQRKNDIAGLGFAWHQFHKALDATNESVVEVFYKLHLTNSVYIQPDFQYIINSSGNGPDSFAIGLRSMITF